MDDRFSFGGEAEADIARLDQVRGVLQGVARVLDLAAILARSGRRVDLAGIDRKIGYLCAQALDLPAEMGRGLVPALETQIANLDQLTDLLKPRRS